MLVAVRNPEIDALPSQTAAIFPFGTGSIGAGAGVAGAPASAVWPTANLAMFIPFRLSQTHVITKLAWHNGATASGNVDCGIYNAAGTKLASTGATAQTGTSAIQQVTLGSALTLPPGLYYLALVLDNGTGTIFRAAPAVIGIVKLMGIAQMASAYPLPASATLTTAANLSIPCVSATVSTTASGAGALVAMPVISTMSLESIGAALAAVNTPLNGGASAVWPSASRAIFTPFSVSAPVTITRLGWMNGAAVSGNVDCGIYSAALARLASTGGVAQATTDNIQSHTLGAALTLQPGLYYMALVIDNTTGTTFRQATNLVELNMLGVFQMASAYPLPTTATVTAPASNYIPAVGCTQRSFW